MKNQQLELVRKEILKQGIYDDCEYLGVWKEYDVYNPIFSDGIDRELGLPEFIIVKDGRIEFRIDQKTVFEILDYFN